MFRPLVVHLHMFLGTHEFVYTMMCASMVNDHEHMHVQNVNHLKINKKLFCTLSCVRAVIFHSF